MIALAHYWQVADALQRRGLAQAAQAPQLW